VRRTWRTRNPLGKNKATRPQGKNNHLDSGEQGSGSQPPPDKEKNYDSEPPAAFPFAKVEALRGARTPSQHPEVATEVKEEWREKPATASYVYSSACRMRIEPSINCKSGESYFASALLQSTPFFLALKLPDNVVIRITDCVFPLAPFPE